MKLVSTKYFGSLKWAMLTNQLFNNMILTAFGELITGKQPCFQMFCA